VQFARRVPFYYRGFTNRAYGARQVRLGLLEMFDSFHDEQSSIQGYGYGTHESGDGGGDGGGHIDYNEAILSSKFCISPVGDSPSCRYRMK
jgi:hypothetical protein